VISISARKRGRQPPRRENPDLLTFIEVLFMTMPKNRSRSVRKIKHRLPSGANAIRYVRRKKGKKHSCATCGALLQATHSTSALKPSARRPERKFGGMLCGACAKRVLICRARIESGQLSREMVEVRLLPYLKHKA